MYVCIDGLVNPCICLLVCLCICVSVDWLLGGLLDWCVVLFGGLLFWCVDSVPLLYGWIGVFCVLVHVVHWCADCIWVIFESVVWCIGVLVFWCLRVLVDVRIVVLVSFACSGIGIWVNRCMGVLLDWRFALVVYFVCLVYWCSGVAVC